MPLNAGLQGGAGWSSSQRVKKVASKAATATSVQLEDDSVACGTLVIADATAGAFVGVGDAAVADADCVELALGGAFYFHGVAPNRIYVKRVGATNTTVRYVTYV
jgi:hypothetical protein